MKDIAHFEVVALYDENREGISGFTNTLEDNLNVYKSLQLTPDLFQPGTQVIVRVVQCPSCERPTTEHKEGICPCGHDWIAWCQERYAKYKPEEVPVATGEESNPQG